VLAAEQDEQTEKRMTMPPAFEIPLPAADFEKQQTRKLSIVRVKEIPILAFEAWQAAQEDEQAEKRTAIAPAREFPVAVSGLREQPKLKTLMAQVWEVPILAVETVHAVAGAFRSQEARVPRSAVPEEQHSSLVAAGHQELAEVVGDAPVPEVLFPVPPQVPCLHFPYSWHLARSDDDCGLPALYAECVPSPHHCSLAVLSDLLVAKPHSESVVALAGDRVPRAHYVHR
jgi:hypothetical protein